MMWQGRELTEDSWLYTATKRIVRAGDIDIIHSITRTHLDYITAVPLSLYYRWPTELELIKHFGEQPCKT